MFITDEAYTLLYANEELLRQLPDLKIGASALEELNLNDNAFKIDSNKDVKANNTYYSKRLDEWFNTDAFSLSYEGRNVTLVVLRPIRNDIAMTLNSMLHQHSFDVLCEVNIKDGAYRVLKSCAMLDGLPDNGSLKDTSNLVALKFIESFDYYRFKKFIELDNILDRFSRNDNNPISNNFRLKSTITRAEWIHIEILPCDISEDLKEKVLMTITFLKTNTLRPDTVMEEIDKLTSLPTAQCYLNKIEGIIKESKSIEYAIASIDIDHFKIFNEWYGTTAGDVFLHDLGSVFKEFDQKYKTYSGYLGNDNFAILLPNDLDLIKELKNRLVKASKSHGDGTGFLPSIGIYLIEDTSCSVSQMLDRATIAASNLKDGMANRLNYYSSSMMSSMEKEYKLLHDAINSIKNDEFVIYFQPKVNMENNKIFSAEALVRWAKDGKIIPPNDFIPVLEKTGSIVELDTYVWEKTILWQRSLIDRNIRPIPVSVNVSRIDLYYLDVADIFISLCKKHKVPASLIEIEITESTYAEKLENIQKIVDRLRAFGFKISLDDFGAGYSSLNALKNISVDILKLDIKFLDFQSEKKKAISILESVINMINSLNLSLICEGVETKEAVDVLRSLGCTYAQGFYYYKPMPLASFEQFLALGTNIEYVDSQAKRIAPIKFKEFLHYLSYSDSLLDNILGPVCFLTYDGRNIDLLKVNESFSRLTGIKDIDDKNNFNNLRNMVYSEDKGKIGALFEDAYKNPVKGAIGLVRFDGDHRIVYLEIKIFFIDEKNDRKMYFVSAHDVTEEKRTEISNKANEKIIEALRADTPDSFEYNINTKLLTVSQENKILRSILKGSNTIENFPDSAVEAGIISKAGAMKLRLYATSADSKLYDSTISFDLSLNIDGELTWVRVHGERVDGDNGVKLIMGNFSNITDEIVSKRNEKQSEYLKRLKEESIYSAFVNLSSNILYSIHNKKYDLNDKVFDQAYAYEELVNLILDYVASKDELELLKKNLSRDYLLKCFNENNTKLDFYHHLIINGAKTLSHITAYMYMKDEEVYAYFFIEDNNKDELIPLSLSDEVSYVSVGLIRLDLNTHRIDKINKIALDIYGYSSPEEFNNDLRDDFSNRVLDEDKPALFMQRKKLKNFNDIADMSFRIFVNNEVKHISAREQYINIDGHEYIQELFLDNTSEMNASLKKLDEEQKRLEELIKVSNYNKSILIGINKLYVSSYACDIDNNKYEALKYSKQMSELISLSSTWEEFMINYAKCYVHSENRQEFIKTTSLDYIKKHLTYENDRISIRYKRLSDNSFKWYKMYLIASQFKDNGMVSNIIFAVRDVNNDTKTKEEYQEKITYYKDLFLNSSIDVYSGMLLIDLDSLETKDIVFNGKDVNERLYKDPWDKTFSRILNKIDDPYKEMVNAVLSPDGIRAAALGSSKTVKYRLNLGMSDTRMRYVATTVRIMSYNQKRLATLFTIDITDDIRALEEAEAKSDIDEQTGLYNRKKLESNKKTRYPKCRSLGVIFFDINDLKLTNDTYGHKAGDALIKTASKSILAICDNQVLGYRYGGDEFLVICEDYASEDMEALIEKWRLALDKCNTHANIICSMSYGKALSRDERNLDTLILEADKDMYLSKAKLKDKMVKKDSSKLASLLLKYIDTDYMFIYEVDLTDDSYRLIHVNQMCPLCKLLNGRSYTEAVNDIINKLACQEDMEKVREALSIEELKKCYIDKLIIECRTKDCKDYTRIIVQAIEFEGGEAKKVMIAEEKYQNKFIS